MGLVIGLTGTMGAGKGTVSEILVNKGFAHYSVREFLLEKIRESGLPENRDSLVKVANELRKKNGPAYITEQLYERATQHGQDAIIESIRTEGEVNLLREKDAFYLFAVDASAKIRYERIMARKSSTDSISFEEFKRQEEWEMTSTDTTKQNLKRCIDLADKRIVNDGSVEELKEQVEECLHDISRT